MFGLAVITFLFVESHYIQTDATSMGELVWCGGAVRERANRTRAGSRKYFIGTWIASEQPDPIIAQCFVAHAGKIVDTNNGEDVA